MSRVSNDGSCKSESHPTELFEPLPQSKASGQAEGKPARDTGQKDSYTETPGGRAQRYLKRFGAKEGRLLYRESDGQGTERGVARLDNHCTGSSVKMWSVRTEEGRDTAAIKAYSIQAQTDPKAVIGLEASAGAAWTEVAADDRGDRFGVGFSAAEVAVRGGKPASKQRDNDEQTRVGLSAGVGLGLRIHDSDDDGDGVRERGIGVDVGPLSFDIKRENWAHTLLPALRWADDRAKGR
jgi:hypothetical protein